MISKNELKHYSSLLRKKFRNSEKQFLAEGKKIVTEGLNSDFKCELIFVSHQFAESENEFLKNLRQYEVQVEVLKNNEFSKLSDTQTPQGIAAVFNKTGEKENKVIELSSRTVVCLENISDPGNLGTIIRNCDWFGVSEILLDKACTDIFNPKVIRSSAGSVFHVKFFENIDLFEIIPGLKKKGYRVLCADIEGDNFFEFDEKIKSVLIFANEANGPSMQALSLTDVKITIPKIGKAESLNVASASAVILANLTRM